MHTPSHRLRAVAVEGEAVAVEGRAEGLTMLLVGDLKEPRCAVDDDEDEDGGERGRWWK